MRESNGGLLLFLLGIMMKFRFLNRTIENKRFEYKPMYYDERKEDLKRIVDRYADDKPELSKEERIARLKGDLRNSYDRADYRQNQMKSSNIRVLLLIGGLLVLGYFVFNGVDEVDTVVKKLW